MEKDKNQAGILLIYTGGTIGMVENTETGALETLNFQHLVERVPELEQLGHKVDTYLNHRLIHRQWDRSLG